MTKDEVDLFTLDDNLSYKFYQMPKELFVNSYYHQNLSLESKVAYTFLLDRLELSRINGWVNEKKQIYLIYTRQEIMNELRVSKVTAVKIFNELRNCNLIKEERLGLSKPNRIYIGKLKVEQVTNNQNSKGKENKPKEDKNQTSGSKENKLQNDQNYTSGSLKTILYKKTNNINTKNIDTKFKFKDKVFLTSKEWNDLKSKHGEKLAKKFIDFLDIYKKSTGKYYESDYNAILSWVVRRVKDDERKNSNTKSFKLEDQRKYSKEFLESFYDNI